MIDAKRLKELMKPEQLRSLAGFLDSFRESLSFPTAESKVMAGFDGDALDCAAAVLREVAGRRVDTDKVIEIDLDDPGECRFCQYEQGICMVDNPAGAWDGRPCVQGSASDPENAHAPEWCPARGRIIIQAKAPTPTQATQPPNEADIAPNADSGHSGINAAGSDENG